MLYVKKRLFFHLDFSSQIYFLYTVVLVCFSFVCQMELQMEVLFLITGKVKASQPERSSSSDWVVEIWVIFIEIFCLFTLYFRTDCLIL